MNKSNFFLCIGAQKGGSTWLHYALSIHPSIALPPVKELHFFDEIEEGKGNLVDRLTKDNWFDWTWRYRVKGILKDIFYLKDLKSNIWALRYYFIRRKLTNIDAYKKLLLKLKKDVHIVGEITPDYSILSKDTINSIQHAFPKLKIILLINTYSFLLRILPYGSGVNPFK
ncbi:hypothetical protein MHTCC0001_02720 [Flavobacteriaceae bacterium MHTCC 0001]